MWWKRDHQTVNEAWICHFLLSVILYEYRAQWGHSLSSGSQASLERVVYQRHEIGKVTVQIKKKKSHLGCANSHFLHFCGESDD